MSRIFIVEADGGSRGNPGPAAYGSVVREAATGDVLVELAGHLGVTTNNVAEYTGLLEGLRAVAQIDPLAQVEARLDSKLVVEQMSGRWAIKNDALRRIAIQARDVLPRDQVTYTWVPRERNTAADKLANESMDDVEKGGTGFIRRVRSDAYELESELEVIPEISTAMSIEGTADRPTPAIPGWGPDLGAPTVSLLVRHGVTAHSMERRFSGSGGQHDPELTDLGRAQIEVAARELARRGGADVLVCSPMLRTRQSAEIIAEQIGCDPIVIDGLQEAQFGDWDGHTFAEVMQMWPAQMSGWLGSADMAPPGGESLRQVYERVSAAFDTVLTDHPGKRIIVAAHVGTIRSLTVRALNAPLSSINRLEIAPASLTTLSWYADGNASLRSFAEAAHLDELQQTWVP